MEPNQSPAATSKLEAQPERVIDLVAYQEGCVLSREIIKRKTGTVTLFAFDEEQGLSEHTAPFDALVHLVEGEMKVEVAGKPFDIQAGEIVILPANQPHALKAVKKTKMILTMIRS